MKLEIRVYEVIYSVLMGMLNGGRLLLLSCAKSHMLSASRRQPRLLHVSAVDRRQTWSTRVDDV